ncbi:ADP/ATP transporter on adenylate translocase (macronuclear) [Tetrahymena thermophila SB210]|uniref:ADP/ATP translocase n=1 Tax=Tetrahymena thermophila (strain SB210) TaxID=312017 RepID=I7LVV0_TETTS|nr:ADP/ATP transporter on adenylate translocase [Tetrahymena thermophila SB210]EAR99869.1 ADP/ATP transporter on adenylate translocase [Tetrahymena thermophila SB210]|eukprot:XP_001020114.1 ADP/ATP transporter on adenylate translocase [Tetrahymena thermophila SB210]
MSNQIATKKKQESNFISNFIMGGLSAGISKTVAAPLERIKIIFQTQDVHHMVQSGKMEKYLGITNTLKQVYKQEGLLSLWRGNLINVIRYIPTQALNLAFVDLNKSLFKQYDKNTQKVKFMLSHIFAGGMAGAQSQVFVYPFEFARTRLAADLGSKQEREYNSLSQFFKKIYQTSGIQGFYKGFWISIVFAFVYRGVYFGLYNSGKEMLFNKQSVFVKFLAAQAITALAGTIVYPIDTVRRRLMMQSGRSDILYNSSLDCLQKIYQQEGYKALYKGGLSNVYRGLGGALVLVLYDELHAFYENKF